MVKWQKKRVFGVFDPTNHILQKYDSPYHVENFSTRFLKKKISEKWGLDVILTSQSRDFGVFVVFLAKKMYLPIIYQP